MHMIIKHYSERSPEEEKRYKIGGDKSVSTPLKNISNKTHTGHTLTNLEEAFISSFIVCKNATQAAREAGYKAKHLEQQARRLLDREYIAAEVTYRLQAIEDAKVAKATEILQFYTSVMRGEVLDQFGIEASLDTRIKAANELARHQIELPMKLEQKNITNNIGSITLNFIPRSSQNEEIEEISGSFEEISE